MTAKMKCSYCGRDISKCRVDRRGQCIKSPLSDGKAKRRTKVEKEYDDRVKQAIKKETR